MFLEISQNSQENTCAWASFLIKLQAQAQVFSFEFCEISKSTFFTENLWATASEHLTLLKRDQGTEVFLWILDTFLAEQTPLGD